MQLYLRCFFAKEHTQQPLKLVMVSYEGLTDLLKEVETNENWCIVGYNQAFLHLDSNKKNKKIGPLFAQEIKEFNDRSTQKCALIIHKTSRFYGKVTIQYTNLL